MLAQLGRLSTPKRAAVRHGTVRTLSPRTVAALLLGGVCMELLAPLTVNVGQLLARTLSRDGFYRIAPRL